MDKQLNDNAISKVLNNISQNIKLTDYLMDTLDISRESVYRRLRGDIPFTFDEIIKLSLDLNFSIDEIIGQNEKSRVFFDLIENRSFNPQQTFLALLGDYHQYITSMRNAENIETTNAINRVLMWLALDFDHIFKFAYFKWAHQTYKISANTNFSEIEISPEIILLRKKINHDLKYIAHSSYILDQRVLLHTIREIQYYYRRKLITEAELLLIKEDLMGLVDKVEAIARTGINSVGATVDFYLSSVSIESNSMHTFYDNKGVSYFWIYSLSPVSINNADACMLHKKWLDSLRRYSILITQSNEILQEEFFYKQRKYLEGITDDML
jgi:hypothetical protein